MSDCCKHCDDGMGNCVYPYYGVAPHERDGGYLTILPECAWPDNFSKDTDQTSEDTICGGYTHCLYCGKGDKP